MASYQLFKPNITKQVGILCFLLLCSAFGTAPIQAQETATPERNASSRFQDPESQRIALEIIKQLDPEAHDRLLKLKDSDPKRYQRHLRQTLPMLRRLIQFKKRDAQLYAAGLEVARIKIEIRKSLAKLKKSRQGDQASIDREAVITELKSLITQKFDAELAIRERQLEMLQEQMAKAETQIKDLKDKREQQIEKELAQHTQKKNRESTTTTDAMTTAP